MLDKTNSETIIVPFLYVRPTQVSSHELPSIARYGHLLSIVQRYHNIEETVGCKMNSTAITMSTVGVMYLPISQLYPVCRAVQSHTYKSTSGVEHIALFWQGLLKHSSMSTREIFHYAQ